MLDSLPPDLFFFIITNTWFSGIILFFFLMATAFMGYVLPFGQMSFWGATVITNLLSPFPSLIEWVSGGHYVYNPTLKRFFIFHFQFPFLLCGFRILHLFYLHFLSSNNPLRNSTNNKIPFFPFIFQKDFFGFILILCLYLLQTHKDKRGDLSNHFLSLIFHLLPTVGALPGLGCHLVIHLAVTKDLTSSWKFSGSCVLTLQTIPRRCLES
jgi:hypothetical protein